MSRSKKKMPVFKKTDRYAKRRANHIVRHSNSEFPLKGNAYKRCFPSWIICEHTGRWTLEEALKTYRDPIGGNDFASIGKQKKNLLNIGKGRFFGNELLL